MVSELLPPLYHGQYVLCHLLLSGYRSHFLSVLYPPGWVFGSSSPCPHQQTKTISHGMPTFCRLPAARCAQGEKVPPGTRSHRKYLMQSAKTPTRPAYARGDGAGGATSSPNAQPAALQPCLAVANSVYPRGIPAPYRVGFLGAPSLGRIWDFCSALLIFFFFVFFSSINGAFTWFHMGLPVSVL